MPVELKFLSLKGYKTYREIDRFEPRRLSILLGGNGAGKSNLVSFFRLLYRMMAQPGELQLAVSEAGGAHRLLHDGPKETESIRAKLELQTGNAIDEYEFRLSYAANDTLIFTEEKCRFHRPGFPSPQERDFGAGHREAILVEKALDRTDQTSYIICSLLRKCVAYQFHDTSFNAGMRGKSLLVNSRYLKSDASNLAAFLHRLSQGGNKEKMAFKRIEDTARLVLPFLAEFILEPENGSVLLQWRERGSEEIFAASQSSDGMLRILALVTLLCQPPEDLPAILFLDEPELGLHPQAISLIAALIREASRYAQIVVATQSVPLVDEFSINDIVVLSRPQRESKLQRLEASEYAQWLEEYSVGELWRKNLVGGGAGQ